MANQLFLGIECGGTRTVALLADANGRLVRRLEVGAANLRLLTDAQLLRHFKAIAKSFPKPTALAIGMAGMRTEADHRRIATASAKVWPRVPCAATDDLETALAAGSMNYEGRIMKSGARASRSSSFILHPSSFPRVLVLSGTGSCCYGKSVRGKTAKVGGWGHILGDGGSGYEIGLLALKAVIAESDRSGKLPELGRRFLRALQLNEPSNFIAWAQAASKTEIAALAKEVFVAAKSRDKIATQVLEQAATSLAQDAVACARQLAKTGTRVEFVLAGSILLKQPSFAKHVASRIKKLWRKAVVAPLNRESAWGAVELAKREYPARSSAFRRLPAPNRLKASSRRLAGCDILSA